MRTLSSTRTLLLAMLAAAAMLLAFGAQASFAADPVDPVTTYEGTLTMNSSDGFTLNVTARLTSDCSDAPCTARVDIIGGDFVDSPTNGEALPLADGIASAELPYYGDVCALRMIGAGTADIEISGDSASVTRTSAAVSVPCGDGSTGSASSAVVSGVLALVSGEACLADGTCALPEPTPSASPSPSPTLSPTPSPSPSVTAPTSESSTFEAPGGVTVQPTVLSELRTTSDTITAQQALLAGGGAVILALLIAFPASLLDAATERVVAWFEARRVRRGGAPREPSERPPLTVLGWPLATAGLLVAAVASAYVEPDFGLTFLGLQTTVGILIGFLAVIALGWAAVWGLAKLTSPEAMPRIEFKPLTLLAVAVAVVFSRATHFEPGVIFGLIAGVGFGAAVAARIEGRAALFTYLFTAVAGAGGWWGYSAYVAQVGEPSTWLELMTVEVLSAIAITAFSALPIAMLPLRSLAGHALWAWNKVLWVGCYALALAAFFLVLLPLPDSWQAVDAPLATWMGLYVAYAVVAVLAWLATLVLRDQPEQRER